MRSLYVRIIWILLSVICGSVFIAFLLSNMFYKYYLKDITAYKTEQVAKQFVELYSEGSYDNIQEFLEDIGNLNYNVLAIDQSGKHLEYGQGFREKTIDEEIIKYIQQGNMHNGIREKKESIFVTGFFENTVSNSVGIPLKDQGQTYALFIRPDLEANFGELRILLGLLLLLTVIFSIILITILVGYVVNPIKKLQKATKQIADGNFEFELNINRKDEIGALAHDFSKMSKQLQRLDDMRQEFVSNVSHEIQSPLTSMNGFAKILRNESLTKEQENYYLKIIEDESMRLSTLSKQLLMLAQLDSEVVCLNKEVIHVREQIKHVCETLSWQWKSKHQTIVINESNDCVLADRNLLHQVWQNLLSNSIKFSEENTVITVLIDTDSQNIFIEIADEGLGIESDAIPFVFDRFYKEDMSRQRKKGGSGLGLAITKKIIELHKGKIEVESQKGVGTKMRITLPL